MKFLALIPARGGSKRLPRKNVLPLGGQPLIAWTIALAKQLGSGVNVLVSTDDVEIAGIASQFGVAMPWLRPPEIATDTASSADVAIHALDDHEARFGPVDGLILLQPTSPFRLLSTVQRGIRLFSENSGSGVIGMAEAASHPEWCFTVEGQTMTPYVKGAGLSSRSQDLPPAYEVSGVLYIVSPRQLREQRSFFASDAVPVLSESVVECIDIDTEWDWFCAEKAVESGLVQFGGNDLQKIGY